MRGQRGLPAANRIRALILREASSAGAETHGLNANAVRVIPEAGVHISGQRAQHTLGRLSSHRKFRPGAIVSLDKLATNLVVLLK